MEKGPHVKLSFEVQCLRSSLSYHGQTGVSYHLAQPFDESIRNLTTRVKYIHVYVSRILN
jgi:hypothetical protein